VETVAQFFAVKFDIHVISVKEVVDHGCRLASISTPRCTVHGKIARLIGPASDQMVVELNVASGCDTVEYLQGGIVGSRSTETILDSTIVGAVDVYAVVEYPVNTFGRVCEKSGLRLATTHSYLAELPHCKIRRPLRLISCPNCDCREKPGNARRCRPGATWFDEEVSPSLSTPRTPRVLPPQTYARFRALTYSNSIACRQSARNQGKRIHSCALESAASTTEV